MAYATLEELKERLKIQESDTSLDSVLEKALGDAQRLITDVTHRQFDVAAETTRYVDCTEECVMGRILVLPFDVHSVSQVVNGDGAVIPISDLVPLPRLFAVTGDVLHVPDTPDAWPFYELHIKRGSSNVWTYDDSPEAAIAITGKWGFSETPPDTINGAALDLAIHLYRLPSQVGDVVVSNDGVMVTPDSMPLHVWKRLYPYIKD